jgi:hypothetical protein
MKMRYILVALGSALAVFALFALRDNMSERKTEAKTTVFRWWTDRAIPALPCGAGTSTQ